MNPGLPKTRFIWEVNDSVSENLQKKRYVAQIWELKAYFRRIFTKVNLVICVAAALMASSCTIGKVDQLNVERRWRIDNGSIQLRETGAHKDHFAMSGRSVDTIVEWQIGDDGSFSAMRLIRFPMLRVFPDNTFGALTVRCVDNELPPVIIDGIPLDCGVVEKVEIRGTLKVTSAHMAGIGSVRTIFPAVSSPALIDYIELTNRKDVPIKVTIPAYSMETKTDPGVFGEYFVGTSIIGETQRVLAPGETLVYAVVRSGRMADEAPYRAEPTAELAARIALVDSLFSELILETPDAEVNMLFDMAKVHTVESIFATRG